MLALASGIFLALGVLLVIVGLVWAIISAINEWRQRPPQIRKAAAAGGPFAGLASLVRALTAFFRLVFRQSAPWRLIAIGVLLLVLGGGLALYDHSSNAHSSELAPMNPTV
jgi:hypothetical protein